MGGVVRSPVVRAFLGDDEIIVDLFAGGGGAMPSRRAIAPSARAAGSRGCPTARCADCRAPRAPRDALQLQHRNESMIEILHRGYGVVIICNRCGERQRTAICGRRNNRAYWVTKGWDRGSDPGTRPKNGGGRPRTTSHDLCPRCLKLDRAAAAARKVKRAAQIAARDAKRKERDAQLRPATQGAA
jgi:hypothetical protein